MLAILLVIYLIYIFIKKEKIKLNLFCLTVILSLFFFSSTDPIVGIPLYFYVMCLSIVNSIYENKFKPPKVEKKVVCGFFIIICLMLLQIIAMNFKLNVSESLLINMSNTDVSNIVKQLYLPVFNFTVFKHFVFYVMYLIFICLNLDLIKNKEQLSLLLKKIFSIYKILFCSIIIEFLIVNIFGGLNDRFLMEIIFSVKSNQSANWLNNGFYSVALWFTEKSEMTIVCIYYLLRIGSRNNLEKFIKWDIVSFLAVFCSDSTTALLAVIMYFLILISTNIKKYKISEKNKPILIIGIVLLLIFCFLNFNSLFEKLLQFVNPTQEFGSAFYRRRSIEYGIKSFLVSPLIGQGIGTIYCHSGLVQVLGNVGILGVIALVYLHKQLISVNMNKTLSIKILYFVFLSIGAFMIQTITSPFMLISVLAIAYNFDLINFNIKNNYEKHKLEKIIELIKKFCYRQIYTFYLIIYCVINRKKDILILGGIGIGDICISMAYFEEFRKKNSSELIIIAPKKQEWLLSRYNLNNCIIKYLNNDMMLHLGCAYNPVNYNFFFEVLKKKNLYISDPWAYIDRKMIYYKEISALNINKDVVYMLDSNASIKYAPIKKINSKIKIKDKSILLNPFSNSSNMKTEDWNLIIDLIKKNGYNIYVNSTSDEILFEGTMPLNISLDELYSIVDKFDMVISIRSGFLDYIIQKCHHVICIYSDRFFYNMYNLEKWNVKNLNIQNFISTEEKYLEKMKEGIKKWM